MASSLIGGCWNEARDETDGGKGEQLAPIHSLALQRALLRSYIAKLYEKCSDG